MTLVRTGSVTGRGRGSSLAVMKEHPFPEGPFPGAGEAVQVYRGQEEPISSVAPRRRL